ncbi:MAG: WYL domain-containing protein [Nitrospirales bacterium]|nr:WYL domain-containing protein [Nitrospirales bacterium]
MPRHDQILRQWHLLRILEQAKGKTIKELAEALPKDYASHERTVRRDLEVLEASGIPLITEKIYGQVRWRFIDGYRNNLALGFSPSEILALRLTRQLLTPLEGTGIQESLQSALAKVEAGVANPDGKTPQDLPAIFAFSPGPYKSYKTHQNTIDTLMKATSKQRTVQMRYFSATRNQTTRREVSPYRLWYSQGALYLIGYCHSRKDVRMFAVERMKTVTPTNNPFQIPLDFNLEDYVKDAIGIMRGQPINVELQFDKPTAAWVKDRIWHPTQSLTQTKSGELNMTLTVADNRELIGWILSFGNGVRVMQPAALRQAVRQEAQVIADQPEEINSQLLDVSSKAKRQG